jgi:hypothetical protein
LTLSRFEEGSARNISNIFKKQSLSRLIKLSIYFCDLDAMALSEVLTNCPQLQFLLLRVDYLSDDGFQHIHVCKNLEHLDSGYNYTVAWNMLVLDVPA